VIDPNTRDIIVNVRDLSEKLRIDLGDEDRESLLATATSVLAKVDQLQINHPGIASASLSADGTSAAWLIKVSTAELVREMSPDAPDWESAKTSFTFTADAVRQLLETAGIE